ncbi:RasGAP protein [Coemansia spiralis]|uniref:RasGAP protein n=1 Tax=Coemansia spiralis TaxID=417178 RepID=A0A9W8G675_9FUNG|nr:RasGAP protein [Coemansia sp. RSA 1358]KAJ2677075.1 RasGAP protein [Coemansia spiralis]
MRKGRKYSIDPDSSYADGMPAKKDETETIVELEGKDTSSTGSTRPIAPKRSVSKLRSGKPDVDGSNNGDSGSSSSWLGRLWCGIRRGRDSTTGSATSETETGILESGAAVVGPIKNPHAAIPADIMFSSKRAALYSKMMTLLIRNPYYISRIINQIKHHECDALLTIILDSVFISRAYEPALTALFTEIIEIEVDRTDSVGTIMRNDAPSVHMLSAYLKKQSCLDYLRTAVGPTIETIIALGNVSLDPELAAVYQDWARSQLPTRRLPLVVSAVEAASYTEVQNLSRRRQGHLSHLASHCLHDIIGTRHHIPAGLLSICASTLSATKRKFPQIDEGKAYSLVGGIFFLRFINAALTSPNQYGLLDSAPTGTMKTNLKLVARLMQRLSNNSSKPPDEWPIDARKFMKINVNRFHMFLASLTSKTADIEDTKSLGVNQENELDSQNLSSTLSPRHLAEKDGVRVSRVKTMPKEDTHGRRKKNRQASLPRKMASPPLPRRPSASPQLPRRPSASPQVALAGLSSTVSSATAATSDSDQQSGKQLELQTGIPLTIVSGPGADISMATQSSSKSKAMVDAKQAGIGGRDGTSMSNSNSSNNGSGDGSEFSTTSSFSVHSMGNLTPLCGSTAQSRRPSSDEGSDVTLPLNDLYLLQKYLVLYEDAWAPNEPLHYCKLAAVDEDEEDKMPMHRCLKSLGDAPSLMSNCNNHKTRICLYSE